jgi:alpha-beta hydrolase superfamily lysophospholipase
MGEHARRYFPALQKLLAAGYVIYSDDHRGHGQSAASAVEYGDFGAAGFNGIVRDLVALTRVIKAEVPALPVFFLGHSLGSMLGQAYLIDHSDLIDGAALCGTTAIDCLQAITEDPKGLAFLNEPFEPARTPFDWLSRDQEQVDLYTNDPLCGFALTPQSMASLFAEGKRLADPQNISRIRRGFPVYIFVGDQDPVNNRLTWLRPLIERYRAAGLDVSTDVYPDARHEILNEINRDEVVGRLLGWLDGQMSQRADSA